MIRGYRVFITFFIIFIIYIYILKNLNLDSCKVFEIGRFSEGMIIVEGIM